VLDLHPRAPSRASKVKKGPFCYSPAEASSAGLPVRVRTQRPTKAPMSGTKGVEGQENGGRAPTARQEDDREAVSLVHQG
jgi:hypothetical protein